MASVSQKIDHVALLDEWLTEPHKFGHLLGYEKLSPLHGEWIKKFIQYKRFDMLQGHRGSWKTTCGVTAMVLLFLCYPNMRLLIVRKTGDLASDILKTIQRHFETNDVLRLYCFSRWNILDCKTKIWSSERALFAFKRTNTPQPSITAAGVGASIVGAHFDYIWSDDIVTIEDRYSAAERRWSIAYFQELENLVDPLGQQRLSGTPWHEEDVFSTIDKKYFEGSIFPVGSVPMPPDELAEIMERKGRLPYAEWCCNYELRHVADNDTLGAFEAVNEWDCQYCVAFIDPSFSDKTDTDSTAVSVVGVSKTGKILFTGMKLPKSISDEPTRIIILDFLQHFTPIETVLESQLAESSIFFLDAFKASERRYPIKNLWTVKRQYKNKHERIAATVIANKPDMRILSGTQQEYTLEVSRYYKGAAHDDCCFVANTAVMTMTGKKQICDVRKGEHVLTPFGFSKVTASGCTGNKKVIHVAGLETTGSHKIYNKKKNCFVRADSLTGANDCEKFSFRGLFKWQKRKRLYSTDARIPKRENIISLAKHETKGGITLNSYIRQYGNISTGAKCQKAITYIIKILTSIIMTFLIWKYLLFMNIYRYTENAFKKMPRTGKKIGVNWQEFAKKRKHGIKARPDVRGIKNILADLWRMRGNLEKPGYVYTAGKRTFQKSSDQQNTVRLPAVRKTAVYNLTVEAGVYYANGILVSNCDSLAGALEHLATSPIVAEYAAAVEVLRR